ncbi:MAG: DNA replication terminus site-binding protein [Plesiomonas sp.]|uniref:DNA replication terminus site-binding protein n=1 Tax=Plesiomonas sp. TaxID=2486279 RepID=UPI003F3630BA
MSLSLKSAKYDIDCALDVLDSFLDRNPISHLWLYELPQWNREDEGNLPDIIPVTEIIGGEELTPLLMKIYRQFYAPETQSTHLIPSTKIVQRYPGLAVCSGDYNELNKIICNINESKDRFANAITAVGNSEQRFEAVHTRFPMMITLQATRHIKLLPCNTKKISFSWQRPIASKSDSDKLNKFSLLEKLTQERRYPPAHIAMSLEGDIWAAKIEEEIAIVEALSENVQLRYRRILREVPQVNWVYEEQHPDTRLTTTLRGNGKVNLPLLTTCIPTKVTPLKEFNRIDAESKHRRPIGKGKSLLPRLNIEIVE